MSTILKIGVLGTGAIGTDHIRRIENVLTDAIVTAVYDVDEARAKEVIGNLPHAHYASSADAVINDPGIDALVITSATATHEDYCLKAINIGKPVFCEKPLANTTEGAKRIVDAEIAMGKKLIQVGFMRRYDSGYVALKKLVESGDLGSPLIAHCAHRNPEYMPQFDNKTVITDTVIHEIDVMSWLMGDYFVKAQVLMPKRTQSAAPHLNDPQLVILTTSTGAIVEIEAFVNCKYGYDIQCEIVAENGTVRLPEPSSFVMRKEGKLCTDILMDWRERFAESYDIELQAWIDAVSRGEHSGGPSSWDGYCAAITADACIRSQETGEPQTIGLTARPVLYR